MAEGSGLGFNQGKKMVASRLPRAAAGGRVEKRGELFLMGSWMGSWDQVRASFLASMQDTMVVVVEGDMRSRGTRPGLGRGFAVVSWCTWAAASAEMRLAYRGLCLFFLISTNDAAWAAIACMKVKIVEITSNGPIKRSVAVSHPWGLVR